MKGRTLLVALGVSVLGAGTALAAEPAIALNRQEAQLVRTAPVSLERAITVAESQTHAKVMNIVSRPGMPDVYRVTLLDHGRLAAGSVDTASGRYMPSGEPPGAPVSQLGKGLQAEAATLAHAPTDLAKAVEAAQDDTHGKAGDAGLEMMRGGRIGFEVRILKNGGFHDVWVDPSSGSVIDQAAA